MERSYFMEARESFLNACIIRSGKLISSPVLPIWHMSFTRKIYFSGWTSTLRSICTKSRYKEAFDRCTFIWEKLYRGRCIKVIMQWNDTMLWLMSANEGIRGWIPKAGTTGKVIKAWTPKVEGIEKIIEGGKKDYNKCRTVMWVSSDEIIIKLKAEKCTSSSEIK